MSEKTPSILKPGIGVDLIFNLSSMSPIVKPSIVFEQNNQQVIVAQPKIKITPDYRFDTMHISSLVSAELSGKNRKGYKCKIAKHIDKYQLANNNTTQALLLDLLPDLFDMNIRAAFRFEPNATHNVIGKLLYRGNEYFSDLHFKVFNISVSGIGLLIPKKIKKEINPLHEIAKNATARVGLILRSLEDKEEIVTIESEVFIVRTNRDYNEKSGFAGIKFQNLKQQNEESLNRFIHNAQLYEIRLNNRF